MLLFSLRNFFSILFLSLIFSVSIATHAANTVKPDELSVGIDLTYAPYAYLNDGQPSGFDPDFMRLLAQKMGLTAKFKDTRIENIIIGLNARHYDIVASALYVNPQRAKQVDFLPYLQTGGVLVVRGDDSFRPQTLEELCGKKISSMKGAAWIPELNRLSESFCAPKGLKPIEVKEFPSAPEAAQALLSKGVDVQYEDAAVAKMVIEQLGGRLAISTKQMINPVLIGLAFNKENVQLKELVAKAFQELKDCLQMTTYIMNEIKVNEHILDDDKYLFIFSVEEVNRLAREGMPFRDAYKKVGLDIEAGNFKPNKEVHHTHEGSIGNLCIDERSNRQLY